MEPIKEFQGDYRWLSNFWPAKIPFDGYIWPTVEHAYQAAKTFDETERQNIRAVISAGHAKRMGRYVTVRHDWSTVKVSIMTDLIREKFKIPELREKLLATGDAELIEGNRWGDTFWGVCKDKGQNYLGKILMAERRLLK